MDNILHSENGLLEGVLSWKSFFENSTLEMTNMCVIGVDFFVTFVCESYVRFQARKLAAQASFATSTHLSRANECQVNQVSGALEFFNIFCY